MPDAEDTGTFAAINELCLLSENAKKPLVIWVGAGASAWCGLPLWPQLADNFHREYCRYESAYDRKKANDFLSQTCFPDFFSYCKQTSSARFNNLLVSSLKAPANSPPVYARFISALKATKQPLQILTTNVDEALEQNLHISVILPTDLERFKTMIQNREACIGKLHGSISSVSSTIFTKEDYASIENSPTYINSIKTIFDLSTVVFVGYGLRDEYILKIIRRSEELDKVFGTGPHFAILSETKNELPSSIKQIQYAARPHQDHRASIQIIEELSCQNASAVLTDSQEKAQGSNLCSAHFLSDIFLTANGDTSQTATAKRVEDQNEITLIIGHGLSKEELALTNSTALHDVVVGLVCFDKIFSPLTGLWRLHKLLGEQIFRELLNAGILNVVHLNGEEVVLFRSPEAYVGELSTIHVSKSPLSGGELTVAELIKRYMPPATGHEEKANEIHAEIERRVLTLQTTEKIIPNLVRSLLLRPSVRQMLGISDFAKTNNIPHWTRFQVLRLAKVVRIGFACQNLGIASIKFEIGNEQLAGPAFAAAFGKEFAETLASYVLAGNFSTNLGAFVQKNPQTIYSILKFRDSPQGISLRKDIFGHLALSNGGEVAASINAGLSSVLPFRVIQEARDNFAKLSVASHPGDYPAVWNDANFGNKALELWKKRSLSEFQAACNKLRLSPYDLCPCGSGEKVKFCCGAALAQ